MRSGGGGGGLSEEKEGTGESEPTRSAGDDGKLFRSSPAPFFPHFRFSFPTFCSYFFFYEGATAEEREAFLF